MKILNVTKYLLAITAIVFIFFNWHASIILFIICTLLHAFSLGPDLFLSVITGELVIVGVVFLFINWKIGIAFIIGGFLMAKFKVWGNQKNYEHYIEKNKNENGKGEK